MRLSYAQLEAASRRIALSLLDVGLKPTTAAWHRAEWGERTRPQRGVVVALSCDRSWEQVAGVIGILRASCVYLPIEAGTPLRRASQLLDLSGSQALLTTRAAVDSAQTWLHEYSSSGRVPVVLMPVGAPQLNMQNDVSMLATALDTRAKAMAGGPVEPRDLAYLIYTSGSTGVPKGVGCHHEGAVNTLDDVNSRHNVCSDDACIALSSLSFDLSVYDIFGLLSVGGRVVLPDASHTSPPSPSEWLSLVAREGVSVWDSVPAFSELLVGQAEISGTRLPSCLRLILMSGDWIPLGLPVRLMSLSHSDLRVVSMGGATEAAIWSNTYEIVDGRVPVGWSSVPYGVPMRGQSIDVLEDGSMRRCEPWVVGMIYIGGLGVALGYVGDEAQTSRSFVRHVTSGEHMFRTGDLGRVRPAGPDGRLLIEILGREDAQVKINGFRVELGEIEAILESDENVLRSCVVLLDGRQLVAFVTVPPTSEDSPQLAPSAAPSAACNDDCSSVAVGSARVAYWRDVYEHVYAPSASDNGGDVDEFAGWTSSFDGTPMPKADMSEWLNDTVQRIKSLCDLRSILEIGGDWHAAHAAD